MHSQIRQDDERTTENGQADDILPQTLNVEAKGAEDGRARDFDIKSVFVVDKTDIFDFIDDETFEGIVED